MSTPDSLSERGRPLVAILVAVTTRGLTFDQPNELALFKVRPVHIHLFWYIDGVLSLPLHVCLRTTTQYLLPSLWLTAECGYDYRVVVGYDEGDPFYDMPPGLKQYKTGSR